MNQLPFRKSLSVFVLIVGFSWCSFAQNQPTISGNIRDAETGEDLIGAAVVVETLSTGAVTNVYGFYALSLPAGSYTLSVQYIGYVRKRITLDLAQDTTLNVELMPQSTALEEIVIVAESEDDPITSLNMGVAKIRPQDIDNVPVLFGEKDVLKTIQLLPGIQGAGEGNSGFFVRGGNADQNLILLDEATVYNASHLLGFFSVFNSDAIKDVNVIKGDMPAQYGGRLSSVLDIRMKEGNSKEFSGTGSIGLISSKLTLEAPIVKDKGSFMVSGRRTYVDLFFNLFNIEDLEDSQLYFYDLNAKANYRLNDRNRVFVSGYFGRDRFGFEDAFGFDWGNATATVRWNHLFSDRLFSNTSFIYSDYDYKVSINDGDSEVEIGSAIQDLNLKQDFDYFLSNNHTLRFGGNLIYHTFVPGEITSSGEGRFGDTKVEDRYALEGAVYISDEHRINSSLSLRYGLRYSLFNALGPGTYRLYDEDGDVTSEQTYDDFESVQYYDGWEPRLGFNYRLSHAASIKGAYSRNNQYVHLLSNSTTTTPTDIWVPSSPHVKPQISDQFSLGYYRDFSSGRYEFSSEVYYKSMDNVIDYKNGADLFVNEDIEAELLFGEGQAYGIEFLLRKNMGQFKGWLSYTLSRSERMFDEINNGEAFPARQDRTHDISLVGTYQFNPKLSLSFNWVYFTGNAVTFPSGRYEIDGRTVSYYTERNGYRMPDYHRLDLGLNWVRRKTDKFESCWNFSLYNAYGRENAFSINFQESENNPGTTEAVRLALFKFVPSVAYTIKF
ncbi:MAG: TonB-dependent receptor [Bacteroidota bacterium]